MSIQRARATLHLVPATSEELCPSQWFCGRCGAPTDRTPPPTRRICGACGLGILLEARADIVPQADEPFLVVDGALTVQAVSAGAERLLAVAEGDVVERPVAELLVPADAEARDATDVAQAIAVAARHDDGPHRVTVRPANVFGVRIRVRIGACGPPRAALLVLEP